jgi:hypothetical protein
MQRTRDGQALVGYSVAGRSGGQVTPCAVCTVHMEMRSACFLVEPQNQGQVSWLSLKTKVDGLSVVWPQNHWDSFLRFGLKTDGDGFALVWPPKLVVMVSPGLTSKLVAQIFWFGLQNRQLRFGDLGLKSPRWFLGLGLKTMWTMVCRLRHKIDVGRTAWDTC